MRNLFLDSQIVKQYSSARTKCTSMLNLAIAPHFLGKLKQNGSPFVRFNVYNNYFLLDALVKEMKAEPFSLMVDGSNDTG